MRTRTALALPAVVSLLAQPAYAAQPPGLPKRIGSCVFSSVRSIATRLEDQQGRPVPDSGITVTLANGLIGISYIPVPAVSNARPGDRVMTCLVRIPRHCPPGDDRGRYYTTTDLRTMESWTLPDSQHMCGGA